MMSGDGRESGIVLIAGPTASGKSALALDLAEVLDGTIINADSMQIYRELRILSARPGEDEEARVPHKLYGVLSAVQSCSAALWRDLALNAIADVRAEGRLPIIVGGTGLYFRALLDGLAPVPEIPDAIRREIRDLARREPPERLHERLAARDPAMAARLQPGDRQRVARALETVQATGRSLAEWQAMEGEGGIGADERLAKIVILPPRETVYARCDVRLKAMVAAGALEEARRLEEMALDDDLPAMRALGVPHFLAVVRGEMELDDAVTRAQTATRHYAKRQLTWFRHQFADWARFEAQQDEMEFEKIISFISKQTSVL